MTSQLGPAAIADDEIENGTQQKQRVIDIAREFATGPADDATHAEDRDKRMQSLVGRLDSGVFRIVVMGEVKKGKSSFINALLGWPDLLPVDTDVATSTAYKILYGPTERITVFYLPADEDPQAVSDPVEIPRERLSEFGTEAGNPGNDKRVDFIAIELPNTLLQEGVALVDTPGVGGLFKKHRDITFRFAPNADAVLFVMDSVECVISADEIRFLAELRKTTEQVIFLQTKTDMAVPSKSKPGGIATWRS